MCRYVYTSSFSFCSQTLLGLVCLFPVRKLSSDECGGETILWIVVLVIFEGNCVEGKFWSLWMEVCFLKNMSTFWGWLDELEATQIFCVVDGSGIRFQTVKQVTSVYTSILGTKPLSWLSYLSSSAAESMVPSTFFSQNIPPRTFTWTVKNPGF